MSNYCKCCPNDNSYVIDHLGCDPRHQRTNTASWSTTRWLTHARFVITFWKQQDDPLPDDLDDHTLARLMMKAYK